MNDSDQGGVFFFAFLLFILAVFMVCGRKPASTQKPAAAEVRQCQQP